MSDRLDHRPAAPRGARQSRGKVAWISSPSSRSGSTRTSSARSRALIADGQLKFGDRLPPERGPGPSASASAAPRARSAPVAADRGLIETGLGEGAFTREFGRGSHEPMALVILPYPIGCGGSSRPAGSRARDRGGLRRGAQPAMSSPRWSASSPTRRASVATGAQAWAQDSALHAALPPPPTKWRSFGSSNALVDLLAQSREESLHTPGRPRRSHQHHRRILGAIRRRDEAGARRAMLDHLTAVAKLVDGLSDKGGPARRVSKTKTRGPRLTRSS